MMPAACLAPCLAHIQSTSVSTVPLIYAVCKCQVFMQTLPCSQYACMGGSVTPFYQGENSPREVVTLRRSPINQKLGPPEVPRLCSSPQSLLPGQWCLRGADRSPSSDTVTSRGISPGVGLGKGKQSARDEAARRHVFPGVDGQPPWAQPALGLSSDPSVQTCG